MQGPQAGGTVWTSPSARGTSGAAAAQPTLPTPTVPPVPALQWRSIPEMRRVGDARVVPVLKGVFSSRRPAGPGCAGWLRVGVPISRSSQLPLPHGALSLCPPWRLSGAMGVSSLAVGEATVMGTKRYRWTSGSPAVARPGQSHRVPPGGSQDGSCPPPAAWERGFCSPAVPPQLSGVVGFLPTRHPQTISIHSNGDKQTGAASLFLIWKRSGGGGVTLSRAQPALPLLSAQHRCLRTRIPTLSSLEL